MNYLYWALPFLTIWTANANQSYNSIKKNIWDTISSVIDLGLQDDSWSSACDDNNSDDETIRQQDYLTYIKPFESHNRYNDFYTQRFSLVGHHKPCIKRENGQKPQLKVVGNNKKNNPKKYQNYKRRKNDNI